MGMRLGNKRDKSKGNSKEKNKHAFSSEEELDDEEEYELDISVPEVNESTYLSPLLTKMKGSRLTLEMLRVEVPLVHAGREAEIKLSDSGSRIGAETRRKLSQIVMEGESAKERLFVAALPLIRSIATREWQRRQQWGSQIALEDLTQEAIIGFLKGITGFKTDAIGKSATNYLGQWMLVETRRAAEVLDHDLQVGHDAGERFRRIRALRGRLAAEYDREPTDQEIVEASRNPDYVTRPGMVGKVLKDGEERQGGKGVTLQQVAEERRMRSRMGHAARFSAESDNESEPSSTGMIVDPARESLQGVGVGEDNSMKDPTADILREESRRMVAVILTASMDNMGMPDQQREIVRMRYGIPPHSESSAREIARSLGLQRDKVSKIIAAFQQEMTRSGGAFHAVIIKVDPSELYDIGLGWTLGALGEWPKKPTQIDPPSILTEKIDFSLKAPQIGGTTDAKGYMAWFVCDYHDRTFSGLYRDSASIPAQRSCPSCQKQSQRVKVQKV